jgi:hypothetical protein
MSEPGYRTGPYNRFGRCPSCLWGHTIRVRTSLTPTVTSLSVRKSHGEVYGCAEKPREPFLNQARRNSASTTKGGIPSSHILRTRSSRPERPRTVRTSESTWTTFIERVAAVRMYSDRKTATGNPIEELTHCVEFVLASHINKFSSPVIDTQVCFASQQWRKRHSSHKSPPADFDVAREKRSVYEPVLELRPTDEVRPRIQHRSPEQPPSPQKNKKSEKQEHDRPAKQTAKPFSLDNWHRRREKRLGEVFRKYSIPSSSRSF